MEDDYSFQTRNDDPLFYTWEMYVYIRKNLYQESTTKPHYDFIMQQGRTKKNYSRGKFGRGD